MFPTSFKSLLVILVITTLAFFAGSAVVFGWTSGIAGVILSPVLAVFGWYFWLPIFGIVLGLWSLFNPRKKSLVYRFAFVLASCLLGLAVSFLFSAKGTSTSPDLVAALRVACAITGVVAGSMVVVIKSMMAVHARRHA
jgi:hypothetical protein